MSEELHCVFCGKKNLTEIGLGIWECKKCYAQFVFSKANDGVLEISAGRCKDSTEKICVDCSGMGKRWHGPDDEAYTICEKCKGLGYLTTERDAI